ncbi:tautomerase family protein [Bremerella alba]|uniref:Tautomerase n=1 Tax=Bremerella alba TaxID=980252 RepID=A0A7V8VAA7_9BACT|nr:4-oxalocrotonate tautomerase family protein [Bremerella alba]MBA2117859.1 hypothetical protein [Bremerella alba]
MPIITIQITDEGTSRQQKAELIRGVTDVVVHVLSKPPELTHVVIQEISTDNWGVAGLPTLEYRRQAGAPHE